MPTQTETAAPPRGGKPPRPGPRREVDKAAEEMKRRALLPEPPGPKLTWEQMQEYFSLLSKEMWGHVMVYLYRIKPRIIRQLKDPDALNYIDCIAEPFTMEYMIQRHGGGTYVIECTNPDRARAEGNNTHLFKCRFEIDQVRYEPKLNYEELDLNHRDNMSYIQMLQYRGILDNKGKVMQPQQNQNGNGSGVNTEFLKEILGFVSKMTTDQQAQLKEKIAPGDPLTKSIGEILVERMRQDDPSKQMATIQTIMTAMKEMNRGSDITPLFDRLLQMQTEHNTTVLNLMKEMAGMRNQAPANNGAPILDQMDKLLDVFDKLSGLRGGGGGGGRRSGWDVGLEYARELGVPILGTFNNWLAARSGIPAVPIHNPAPPAAPGKPQAPFDPYRDTNAMRQHTASLQQTPPPANGDIRPPAGPVGELGMLLQQYGPLVVNALNNGTPGYDIADYVVGLFGAGIHAMLCAQGEINLLETAMQIPEIALFGKPKVQLFIHEFCNYQEFLDKQARAEEDEAEAIA